MDKIKKILDAEAQEQKILEEQKQEQTIDTTVSVETAKVLDALAKWSALFDSLGDLCSTDDEFTHDFYPHLDSIKSFLDDRLLECIS